MVEHDEEDWAEWPTCPKCDSRRQTACPTCEVPSDAFPLADASPSPAPLVQLGDDEPAEESELMEVLLMCETCNEAFPPRCYRTCHQCGFDFGDGLELQEVPEDVHDEVNSRAILVVVGLVVMLVGLLAFFAIVLRD